MLAKNIISIFLLSFVCLNCFWLKKASSYKASILASNLFVANRSVQDIKKQELGLFFGILNLIPAKIDYENKIVKSLGTTAIYREDLGVCLSHNLSIAEISKLLPFKLNLESKYSENQNFNWESNLNNSEDLNLDKLNLAIDYAFDNPTIKKEKRNTRAIVIIHKGKLIGERYNTSLGFSANTRQVGNSMSKSFINTLIGLRIKDKKLGLDDSILFENWNKSGDKRSSITINNLLQMSSGLQSDETPDVIQMIYCENDMARFGLNKPLSYIPGKKWYYSSASTNILSKLVRNTFENDTNYWNYPQARLFSKLGMTSAIVEADAAGTFIGSSFLWATPRDWAKFGQLYLQNGYWEGEQLFTENWVQYSTSPANSSDGRYGAHFWLNKNFILSDKLPEDTFQCRGLFGQQITIIPSKELVIVRMGFNTNIQRSERNWLEYKYWTNEYSNQFYSMIVESLNE